jgi:hypothetical protein
MKSIEYYSTLTKNEILPFVTRWVDLEKITLSETGQPWTEKLCMSSKEKRFKCTEI